MGMIYRRKKKMPDGTLVETGPYWVKYYRDGRAFYESAETEKEVEARKLLKQKEGDIVRGLPVTPRAGRIKIDELLENISTDYRVNNKRSTYDLEMRINLHLLPHFGGRRAMAITTPDIQNYIAKRQEEGAANASVNRELAILKRAYSLAVQAGTLLTKPYIPMLAETNVRTGFFEQEQFLAVRKNLPEYYRPVVTFAYVTGWRVVSEVLPLEWKQIDFKAGMIRLEPMTTKNKKGRMFPLNVIDELRVTLEDQRQKTQALQREKGVIVPWVFWRGEGERIMDFRKSWKTACRKAGVPGRIKHDFRRTAVRNLVRAGVPEKVAMELTGHKTRAVFDRYDIVSESDLMEAGRKLNSVMVTNSVTVAQKSVQSENQFVAK